MSNYRKAPTPWQRVKSQSLIIVAFAIIIFTVDLYAQNGVRNIHRERSLYRNILVTEDSARLCMRFTISSRNGKNQSCRFVDNPRGVIAHWLIR